MIRKSLSAAIPFALATAVTAVVVVMAWPELKSHVHPEVLDYLEPLRSRMFGAELPATPAPVQPVAKAEVPAPAVMAPAPAPKPAPAPAAPTPAAPVASTPAPAAPVASAVPQAPAVPSVPSASPAPPVVKSAATLNNPTTGKGCVVGGLAGTGLTVMLGPAEIATLIAGAAVLPVTPLVVGATLGSAFLTSCVLGAWIAPSVVN